MYLPWLVLKQLSAILVDYIEKLITVWITRAVKKVQVKKLDVAEMRMLRCIRIERIRGTTRNIQESAGLLVRTCHEKRRRMYGKRVRKWQGREGTFLGRPKQRLMDSIKHDSSLDRERITGRIGARPGCLEVASPKHRLFDPTWSWENTKLKEVFRSRISNHL